MKVLYEDNHIIIVNKQAGEIVQGDKTGDTPLSETVKQYIKEAYAKRKPIIFVTHVPINSLVDQSLANICMGRDTKRRNLTWGTDTYYKPNAQTKELLDMVCAEASPVKAVLAGHLHFSSGHVH